MATPSEPHLNGTNHSSPAPAGDNQFIPATPNHSYNMNPVSAPSSTAFQQMQSNTFYAQPPQSPPVNVLPQKRGKEATYRFDKLTPTGTSLHPESVKRRKTIAKKSGLEAAKFTIRETARSRRRHRKAAAAKKPEWKFLTQIQRDEILKGIDETIQAEIATSDRLAEEHWLKAQAEMVDNGGQEGQHQQSPPKDAGQASHGSAPGTSPAISPPPMAPMMQHQLSDFNQQPLGPQITDAMIAQYSGSPAASFTDSSPAAALRYSTEVDVTPQKRGQKAVIKFDQLTPSGRSKHPAAFKRRRILSQKSGLEAAKFTIRETARSRKRNRKAALMKSAEWPTLSAEEQAKRIKEMEDRIIAEIATSDRQAEREFAQHTMQSGAPANAQNQNGTQAQMHDQQSQQHQYQQQQQAGEGQDQNMIMPGMDVQFQYHMHPMSGVPEASTLKVKEWSPRTSKRGPRGAKPKPSEEDLDPSFLDPQLQAEDDRMRAGPTFTGVVDPSLTATMAEPTEPQQALEPLAVESQNIEVVGAQDNTASVSEPVAIEEDPTTTLGDPADAPREPVVEDGAAKGRVRPAKRGRGRTPKKPEGSEQVEAETNETNENEMDVNVTAEDLQHLVNATFVPGEIDTTSPEGIAALKASINAAMKDFDIDAAAQALDGEQAQQEGGENAEGADQATAAELNAEATAAFEIANQEDPMSLSHEAQAEPEPEDHEMEDADADATTSSAVTASPARGRGRPANKGRGRGRGRKRGGFAGRGTKLSEQQHQEEPEEHEPEKQAGNEEAVLEADGEAAATTAADFIQDGEATTSVDHQQQQQQQQDEQGSSPAARRRSGRVGRKNNSGAEDHQRAATTSPNARRRSVRHARNPSREDLVMMKSSPESARGVRRSRRRSDIPPDMEGFEGLEGDEANGWVMRGFRSIFKKIF